MFNAPISIARNDEENSFIPSKDFYSDISFKIFYNFSATASFVLQRVQNFFLVISAVSHSCVQTIVE